MPTPETQLLSRTIYDTDGVTTDWNFSFASGYLDQTHVKAKTASPEGIETPITVTPGMFLGPYQLRISPALASGLQLIIYRDTPKDAPIVDFTDSAGFTEASLDTANKQAIFVASEVLDEVNTSIIGLASASAETAVEAADAAEASAIAAAASASAAAASVASIAALASAAAASAAASAGSANASQASALNALASELAAAASAADALSSQLAAAGSVDQAELFAIDAGASADVAEFHAVDANASAVSANSASSAAVSAAGSISVAQAEVNALLGIGIGTSYVDADGHLIMSYSGTVTGLTIDSNGHLQLTY